MLKRHFDSETYRKMGSPDLGCVIYFMRAGKKIWGSVSLLHFTGEKSKHKGKIELGLVPFKKLKT
jgi:hypothetical protein